ncbi:MAG: hypothetical protein U0168_00810 [Nannocystaceae bacterium]
MMLAALTACGDPEPGAGDTSSGSSGSASGSGSTTATDATASTTVSTSVSSTDGSSGGEASTSAADSGGDSSSSGGIPTEPFSFFVTSLRAMQELSGSDAGFGGDLRFGEEGAGAGLRGADLICATIAEQSMPGAAAKQWRAFLSASAGEDGNPVNAIDRIGEGPWYDRLGRVVAMDKAGLMGERPDSDPVIADDLPNEDGVPNHQPDPTMRPVDNHDTLTGSDGSGMHMPGATCNDWTAAEGDVGSEGIPRVGHSWPRSADNGRHWISEHDAGGCAPGVNIMAEGGPQPGDYTVGAGGGYGGIYCFALYP